MVGRGAVWWAHEILAIVRAAIPAFPSGPVRYHDIYCPDYPSVFGPLLNCVSAEGLEFPRSFLLHIPYLQGSRVESNIL